MGRRRRRGLSLIEILVAVTIMALFAGLASVQAWKLYQESQDRAARVEVQNLSDALDAYRLHRPSYPSTSDGLGALLASELIHEVPRDPWGNEYVYVSPGQKNPKRFDLFSKGRDGTEHTEDDIY